MNAAPVIVGGVRTPARRRPNPSGGQASNTNQGRNSGTSNTILKIYGDDSPGFKLTPQTVLISTLIFMATVVILHIISKI
ncbi:protein transport protein SEC61 subunit beta, putative [Plasmodium berghei]|uniref:Protein transport protein Sec61 subunit beta n=2 Tax=Plasmodium berghei TaxID=5821 RepID=A0A509AJQ6_PLABA|nr:protein transport protein SEC61 subunit beta, putative [Plasmodium berghei ANKA]CXI24411.1 protein transport protein SEC61 subunit beta, putative [Plasmodium berghei]SCM20288.1 protein transport protein SEC61 subunit beta, putative [Plasmodium berghei]SCN23905.1 protein transport protein SEC61 subunit beta, putative [Plasmodium berghei]SCO59296.1 protein transport protein SEC61 subunit beta, putative [Plasmodium berghei]SCO60321.1 protein transport protein SEC61 subunit beta, putative [Plas|eukprot:XP_034420835.1 protein transport protein SEC61 subunit beta, putative [Plasmodium berghei ANKA]